MLNIGFIGTGNMATALIKSIKSNIDCNIISSDSDESKLARAEKLGVNATKDNKELVEKSEIIFLCVKPKDINSVLEEIKDLIENKIIVSIAAGIKIENIEKIIGDKKIARVMPNVNCLADEMAAAYSSNKNIDEKDKKIISKLLNSAGLALEVKENKMDIVTALSGSGPAFAAYIIKLFAEAGIKQGLNEEDAYNLALQTFYGTSSLLKKENIDANELIKMVSSPGGTTVAGREILENSNIKEIIEKTKETAFKRSKELGK